MIWTEIFSDEKIKLFHTLFKKMKIIKIKEQENQDWHFKGCYVLNLNFNNDFKKLSDFHFYTTDFILNDSVKRICIQPLSILNDEHKKDNDDDINTRLQSWWKNGKQFFDFGLDVLGQTHGKFIQEKIEAFQSGLAWDEIKIENNKKRLSNDIKTNLENVTSAVLIAHKLCKDEIIELILSSKKVTIEEIFS